MNRILYKKLSEEKWLNVLNDDKIDFQFLLSSEKQSVRGWQGTEDRLESHLLFFVESGIIEGKVNGTFISLPPASLIWVTPMTKRQFWLKSGIAKTKNYRLRFNFKEKEKLLSFQEAFIIKKDAWNLSQYFQIISSLKWKISRHSGLEKRALIQALFAAFFDLTVNVDSQFRKFNNNEMRLIENEINMNLLENLTQAGLAKKLGYSQDYFTRVFKETYAMPPRTYLKRQRLFLAAELLMDTQLNLKEICHEINEDNISKFCRQFKDVFKCTPTQYRKQ